MSHSPHRKHNRDSFYKYVSSSTAKKIIENQTLRWSSPVEFNDPFDVPRELLYGVKASDIKREVNNYFAEIIKTPPEDTNGLKPKVKLIVDALKKNNSEELKTKILSDIEQEEIDDDFCSTGLEEMRQLWCNWIPEMRILCLCESNKETSMWYHYAEQYKGIVIELSCCDELDSVWLGAEPINYIESVPEISTAQGWAQMLFMPNNKQIFNKLFKLCCYSKTPDWRYEKEWRVATFKRPHEIGTISDFKFHYKELKSIFLGPLIASTERAEILLLAKELTPHTFIYETEIGMCREFKFNRIDNSA
jgi:hypothetical protein